MSICVMNVDILAHYEKIKSLREVRYEYHRIFFILFVIDLLNHRN